VVISDFGTFSSLILQLQWGHTKNRWLWQFVVSNSTIVFKEFFDEVTYNDNTDMVDWTKQLDQTAPKIILHTPSIGLAFTI